MSNFLQRLRSQTFGGILGSQQGDVATPPDLGREVNPSTAPLAVMDRPKYSYGTAQYPEDLGTAEFGHYILFHIYAVKRSIYQGPQVYNPLIWSPSGKNKKTYDQLFDGVTSSAQVGYPVAGPTLVERDKAVGISGGLKKVGGRANSKTGLVKTTDSIALYMPPGLKATYKAGYKNTELGLGGVITQSLAGSEINSIDTFISALNTRSNWATMKDSITELIGLKGALKIGGFLGAGDPTAAYRAMTQKALNPALEAVFQSVDLRTFDFTFRFTPRSESEVGAVKNIIDLFKFHMHPERVQGQDVGRHLIFPGQFDIHYMYQGKENTWYPFTGSSVLNSCDVTYGPGGESQHFRPIRQSGGDAELPAPTEINMTLNFTETEMMTKETIKQGY